MIDQLSDEQAEALDHARNALAVHATQLRGIERDYRARLLDEPARLVASAAEQAERSAEVIARMLNPLDPRSHGDGAEARSLSGSAGNPIRTPLNQAVGGSAAPALPQRSEHSANRRRGI